MRDDYRCRLDELTERVRGRVERHAMHPKEASDILALLAVVESVLVELDEVGDDVCQTRVGDPVGDALHDVDVRITRAMEKAAGVDHE